MLSVATEMRSILCLSLLLFPSSSGTLTPSPSHPCNLALFPSADSDHPRSHSPRRVSLCPIIPLPPRSPVSPLSLSPFLHAHPPTGAFVGSDGLKTRRIAARIELGWHWFHEFSLYRPFVNLVLCFCSVSSAVPVFVKFLSRTRYCLEYSNKFHGFLWKVVISVIDGN